MCTGHKLTEVVRVYISLSEEAEETEETEESNTLQVLLQTSFNGSDLTLFIGNTIAELFIIFDN